jgi:hypothetical protein
LLSPE